jgi:hypothetical protein
MKQKTTGIWFVLAASLFAFIWLYQKYLQPAASNVNNLLPGLHAVAVTRIQVSPAGQREISVVRSNGVWLLQKPLVYPAQAAAVDLLVDALAKLTPVTRLSASELKSHTNADMEFGFASPQFTLYLDCGDQQLQVLVGNRTPPGDQIFLRVTGADGVFVTDARWLQLLPHSANDWRDTALMDNVATCDWIVVTNGGKAMEFRRDPTNQLWRMIRPLQARADGSLLVAALQQLRDGRAAQFVTDDPHVDMSNYGLQPAELSVWLGQGTNLTAGIAAGKSLPDNSAQVYARRERWNAVVSAAKDTFKSWRGSVNDYRDTHLFTVTEPVAEIEVHGEENYTLQQRSTNEWAVAGEKYPADMENVQAFLKMLAGLRVSDFVKDVVTAADLQGFGLAEPSHQIILRAKAGDTNSALVRLLFGATETNRVLVKRGDEDFVYALKQEDVARLPEHGWEFRDRRVWKFSETNIAQVTLRQNGKTRQLIRTGDGKWSLGAGSQGIINPPAIEETFHRIGELTAAGWVGHNITEPEKYGLNPDNLSMTIELNSGEKFSLDFGAELAKVQTALAAVNFGSERWVFVFPPVLYQFVTAYLLIPADTP